MRFKVPGLGRGKAEVEPAADGAAAWTGGSALAAKAVFALFVAALVAGPAALVFVAFGGTRTPVAAVSKEADVPGAISDTAAAGEAGLRAVIAWLRSTSRDEQLPVGSGMRYPAKPDAVTDAHVAQVTPGSSDGSYVVLVATQNASVVSYVSVPVMVSSTGAAPMALPVPVPAPALADPLRASYDVSDLASSVPLSQTVAAVANAYAKGDDLTRYSSPGAGIASLEAGRYFGASLTQVMASQTAGPDKQLEAPSPSDGARARVYTQFQLLDAAGKPGRPSALALLLTARAGRWEVSAIEGAPSVRQPTAASPSPTASASSPTPSSSPSGPGQ